MATHYLNTHFMWRNKMYIGASFIVSVILVVLAIKSVGWIIEKLSEALNTKDKFGFDKRSKK